MRFVVLVVALCIGFITAPSANAATYPCFQPPADYITAFDTVRGQPADGAVTYPEPRWYDEQQSWATPPGVPDGHHSDHMHMGLCVPNGAVWSSTNRQFDVGYTFHNDTAYTVVSAGMTFLCCDANAGPSYSGYTATATQIAALQAAVDNSGNGNVTEVFQSYKAAAPKTNGFKEVRSSLKLVKRTSDAVFPSWILDTRWYETDNVSGLADAPGIGGQVAVRNRSHVQFPKPGDPTIIKDDYHHSGWCGLQPGTSFGATQTAGSAQFTTSLVSTPWTGDTTICLYVTDGGGPATLMIDPDFHHHYDAPTSACPNVDANGNCLGVWFWQPTGGNLFASAGVQLNVAVTIPESVIASLTPGPHRLVFKSQDVSECFRVGNPCPSDVRGSWTNVSVLPFRR